ncbi:MAG: ATP-binding protein [Cyanobacteria bacterium CRU_2_1]|nr:ATP-binding protein [Cyanobacteria bacterium RU_5_0]NJR58165.1 ATP-binding protein [Cyanobacteria bacterium CRU_2_1]
MSDINFWKPIYPLFKPDKPLIGRDLQELYVWRDRSPVERLVNRLEMADEPTKFLLSGHRGSGKTTELRRLELRCRDSYTVVWVDTETNLDRFTIGYAEVIVLIGKRIVEQLSETGWQLPNRLEQNLTKSLAKVTYQTKEEAGGTLQLPKVLQDLGMLLKVGFQRDVTRIIDIRPALSGILNAVNEIVEVAEQNKPKLLVIVDGLDKLDYAIALEAFRSSLLTELDCHIIYTIPIALRYSTSFRQPMEVFPYCLDVLNPPVFKCDENGCPTSEKDDGGRELLATVVKKRLTKLGATYASLFQSDALELLCEKSGGVFRDLIRLAVDAFEATQSQQQQTVDREIAQAAVRDEQRLNMIRDYHYPELEYVHRTGRCSDRTFRSPERGEITICDELLQNKLILGYESPQGSHWFDVHPILLDDLERWRATNA